MKAGRFWQKQISRCLDGGMTVEEQAGFEQELQLRPEVTRLLAANRLSRELLQELPQLPAPEGFINRVRQARARLVTAESKPVARGWRLALTAASATFIIGLLFQTIGHHPLSGPVAESIHPVDAIFVTAVGDSSSERFDSSRTIPEFEFTPVAGQ